MGIMARRRQRSYETTVVGNQTELPKRHIPEAPKESPAKTEEAPQAFQRTRGKKKEVANGAD